MMSSLGRESISSVDKNRDLFNTDSVNQVFSDSSIVLEKKKTKQSAGAPTSARKYRYHEEEDSMMPMSSRTQEKHQQAIGIGIGIGTGTGTSKHTHNYSRTPRRGGRGRNRLRLEVSNAEHDDESDVTSLSSEIILEDDNVKQQNDDIQRVVSNMKMALLLKEREELGRGQQAAENTLRRRRRDFRKRYAAGAAAAAAAPSLRSSVESTRGVLPDAANGPVRNKNVNASNHEEKANKEEETLQRRTFRPNHSNARSPPLRREFGSTDASHAHAHISPTFSLHPSGQTQKDCFFPDGSYDKFQTKSEDDEDDLISNNKIYERTYTYSPPQESRLEDNNNNRMSFITNRNSAGDSVRSTPLRKNFKSDDLASEESPRAVSLMDDRSTSSDEEEDDQGIINQEKAAAPENGNSYIIGPKKIVRLKPSQEELFEESPPFVDDRSSCHSNAEEFAASSCASVGNVTDDILALDTTDCKAFLGDEINELLADGADMVKDILALEAKDFKEFF